MKTKEEIIEFLNNKNATLNNNELDMIIKFARENILEEFFYILNNLSESIYHEIIVPSVNLEIKRKIFNGRVDEVIDHFKKMNKGSYTPQDLDRIRERFSP